MAWTKTQRFCELNNKVLWKWLLLRTLPHNCPMLKECLCFTQRMPGHMLITVHFPAKWKFPSTPCIYSEWIQNSWEPIFTPRNIVLWGKKSRVLLFLLFLKSIPWGHKSFGEDRGASEEENDTRLPSWCSKCLWKKTYNYKYPVKKIGDKNLEKFKLVLESL